MRAEAQENAGNQESAGQTGALHDEKTERLLAAAGEALALGETSLAVAFGRAGLAAAHEAAKESGAEARDGGRVLLLRALAGLGEAYRAGGACDRAFVTLDRAIGLWDERFVRPERRDLLALLLLWRGDCAGRAGDFTAAQTDLNQVLAVARQLGEAGRAALSDRLAGEARLAGVRAVAGDGDLPLADGALGELASMLADERLSDGSAHPLYLRTWLLRAELWAPLAIAEAGEGGALGEGEEGSARASLALSAAQARQAAEEGAAAHWGEVATAWHWSALAAALSERHEQAAALAAGEAEAWLRLGQEVARSPLPEAAAELLEELPPPLAASRAVRALDDALQANQRALGQAKNAEGRAEGEEGEGALSAEELRARGLAWAERLRAAAEQAYGSESEAYAQAEERIEALLSENP